MPEATKITNVGTGNGNKNPNPNSNQDLFDRDLRESQKQCRKQYEGQLSPEVFCWSTPLGHYQ